VVVFIYFPLLTHCRGWSVDPKDAVDNYKSMGAALEPMADQLVSAFDLSGYKSVVDLGGKDL